MSHDVAGNRKDFYSQRRLSSNHASFPWFWCALLKESYALIRMESCTKMNEDLQEELIETVRKFASLWDVTSKSLKDNKAIEHVKRLP